MKAPLVAIASLVLLAGLTGCSVESESWMNQSRVEVTDDQFTDTIPTSEIDTGVINAIANYHYRYGNGPIAAVVSYDPRSKINTRGKAEAAAAKLRKGFAARGVKEFKVDVASSPATGDASTTLVSFPAVVANAPQDCGMMPGYNNPGDIQSDPGAKAQYNFGCTIETLMARQVARPSDLLGKDGFETQSDGRRGERVLSTRGYYGDKPNEDLKGLTATEGN